jgi:F-type H+-transporting ATPase subunit b
MNALLIPMAEGGESPLALHWAEFIAAIVFAVLLTVVIAKFVVPRFEATYAERAEAIQGGMEKAERAQAQAEAALAEYQAQLQDARAEAARIREDAKTQGTQIITEMREQAQNESARIKASAEANLEAERNQLMNALRGEIGGLATTLASRIVGEAMTDDERTRRTVDRFLADLERRDAETTEQGTPEPVRQS